MIEYKSYDSDFTYMHFDKYKVDGVPSWFIEFTDIEIQSVSEDVSSGWSMIGSVRVLGDTAIVYKALYKMFVKLSYLFVIFVTVALVVLSILLHFVLKPLYRVQEQAEAILKNEFIIQKDIPYTTEFKDVVKGMNEMVSKVEEIFKKGNESAQRNKELLYNDPTTKLFNRRYLMLKLPDLIKLENKTEGGTIAFVALSGADILNQVLGRQKADSMFFSLANIFVSASEKFEDKVLARVNGTEFTLMLPDCSTADAREIVENINLAFDALVLEHKLDKADIYINLGLYRYTPKMGVGDLLTRADNALSSAKADEQENSYIYEDEVCENAMGKEQWRVILEESIAHNQFSLKFYPTINSKTKEIKHSVMTFTIEASRDKHYFYGDFIAPAINLGLVPKMYIVTLKELFKRDAKEFDFDICSIRLSNEFLKDITAFESLSQLFSQYAKRLKFKLLFEVSDSFAIHNTLLMKSYLELFEKYGFALGINSFSGESKDFNYLKELNPEYLKADCAFLLDQSSDSMSSLQVITDSLGIEIVASFVKTQDELEKLHSLHIEDVQGPVTDIL